MKKDIKRKRDMTDQERKIFDVLKNGKEYAYSSSDITSITGIEKRNIVYLVKSMRNKGVPVCSSMDNRAGGYYLPSNQEELQESIRERSAYVETAVNTLEMLKKTDLSEWTKNHNKGA